MRFLPNWFRATNAFSTAAWFWTQKHAMSKDGKKTYPTASECMGNKAQPDQTMADFKQASHAVNGWAKRDPNGWKLRLIYYKRATKELGVGDADFQKKLDAAIATAK